MIPINNNKIVIVANGESVLQNNYGELINQFDVVGRINNYTIDGYQNQVGSKISIWFNGANKGLYKRTIKPNKIIVFIPSSIQKKNDCDKIVESRLGIKNDQYHLISIKKIDEYEKKCGTNRLTTGTASILWAIEHYKEVYIHGFDFFIDSKSHYFDNKLISTLKNKGIIPKAKKHNMKKERAYINHLIENGKLSILNA